MLDRAAPRSTSATAALLCGCLLSACSGSAPAQAPVAAPTPPPRDTRPNVVLVLADDHAFQAISAYGSLLNHTPNIDRIAQQGIRFDRALVTNSVCGPMRATILTGKYSHANGFMVNLNVFDATQPTFISHLHAHGYQTALVGKWHLGSTPVGFDHYEMLDSQGQYYNPPMITPSGVKQYQGYVTDIIAQRTDDWLRHERDPSRPFVLLTQHKAPHRRWEPALRHLNLYADRDLPEPSSLFDDYAGRGWAARSQDMTIAESLFDRDLKLSVPPDLDDAQRSAWQAAYAPRNQAFEAAHPTGEALVRWRYQRFVKDYLRTVASLDEAVGTLLNTLDELDLSRNTLVVYLSDQGFYLGEHGWFDKRFMYEESLRTPMLMRWPGHIDAARTSDALVSPLDLAPTFLSLAGIPVPEDMQGEDLMPLLHDAAAGGPRQSFYYHYYEHPGWHYVRRHYGVTDGRYKLMHFYEPDVDEWELYDLQTDPHELTNVVNAPALQQVRRRLEAELDRLRAELKVPLSDPDSTQVLEPPPRQRPLPPRPTP